MSLPKSESGKLGKARIVIRELTVALTGPFGGRWVVRHYHDELLESVRRQLVRISIAPENEATFPNGQSMQLRALAEGLRQGDMRLKEREYE
jgi:hypothetical protein